MIKVDPFNCTVNGMIILQFELKIETSENFENVEIFFNLFTPKGFSLRFACSLNNEENLEVLLPEDLLKTILLRSEEYPFSIEVILNERVFVPLKDTIIFIEETKVQVSCPSSLNNSNNSKCEKPNISILSKNISSPLSSLSTDCSMINPIVAITEEDKKDEKIKKKKINFSGFSHF